MIPLPNPQIKPYNVSSYMCTAWCSELFELFDIEEYTFIYILLELFRLYRVGTILTTAGLARGFPKPGRLGGSPGRPGGGMGGCWPNIPKAAAPPRGSPGRPGGQKPRDWRRGGAYGEKKRERERERVNQQDPEYVNDASCIVGNFEIKFSEMILCWYWQI